MRRVVAQSRSALPCEVWSRVVERLTIRAVLLSGFGLMLGLWLFAGYQVTQRLRRRSATAPAVSARYQQAQELLASVRPQVLEASVLLRDALLDPDANAQAEHRQSIEKAYGAIDALLTQYVPFLDSAAERERVDRLRAEIRNFASASDEVLATDSSRWPAEARTLLRRFMPKREVGHPRLRRGAGAQSRGVHRPAARAHRDAVARCSVRSGPCSASRSPSVW